MADEDEHRFKVGDLVKVGEGLTYAEMRPELTAATGEVGIVRESGAGQRIWVLYREFPTYSPDMSTDHFELVSRSPVRNPSPLKRREQPRVGEWVRLAADSTGLDKLDQVGIVKALRPGPFDILVDVQFLDSDQVDEDLPVADFVIFGTE